MRAAPGCQQRRAARPVIWPATAPHCAHVLRLNHEGTARRRSQIEDLERESEKMKSEASSLDLLLQREGGKQCSLEGSAKELDALHLVQQCHPQAFPVLTRSLTCGGKVADCGCRRSGRGSNVQRRTLLRLQLVRTKRSVPCTTSSGLLGPCTLRSPVPEPSRSTATSASSSSMSRSQVLRHTYTPNILRVAWERSRLPALFLSHYSQPRHVRLPGAGAAAGGGSVQGPLPPGGAAAPVRARSRPSQPG